MRRNGQRRPAEEVRADRPVRGDMHVVKCKQIQRWEDQEIPLLAQLFDADRPGGEGLIPPLLYAKPRTLRGGTLMIRGQEDVSSNPKQRNLKPQVWWCRLAVDELLRPHAVSVTSAETEAS